jgi:ketosteroid isomerase-like protein
VACYPAAMKLAMKLALSLIPILASCASSSAGHAGDSEALLAADRAFCADTQARRIEGWVAAFDESGSQVGDRFLPITGRDAIRARMQDFFASAENELLWEPDAARISEGGNLGSTTGRFRMLRKRADGSSEVVMSGRYFDVWRKQDDGSWKLLYDVGDPDVAPGS